MKRYRLEYSANTDKGIQAVYRDSLQEVIEFLQDNCNTKETVVHLIDTLRYKSVSIKVEELLKPEVCKPMYLFNSKYLTSALPEDFEKLPRYQLRYDNILDSEEGAHEIYSDNLEVIVKFLQEDCDINSTFITLIDRDNSKSINILVGELIKPEMYTWKNLFDSIYQPLTQMEVDTTDDNGYPETEPTANVLPMDLFSDDKDDIYQDNEHTTVAISDSKLECKEKLEDKYQVLLDERVLVRNVSLTNKCDLCKVTAPNLVDTSVDGGSWGCLCPKCYKQHGEALVPNGSAYIVNFEENNYEDVDEFLKLSEQKPNMGKKSIPSAEELDVDDFTYKILQDMGMF